MSPRLYGSPEGRPLFYFHGVPGAAVEAAMLHQAALAQGIKLLVVARHLTHELDSQDYLQQLAQQVTQHAAGQPIHLLGFSIGACLALRVAARLGTQVTAVHLLSAAAPWEVASNRVGMGAGRYTFAWAQHSPRLFRAFASYQALLAKVSPRLLLNLLFAGAGGNDRELLRQSATLDWLKAIQRDCFQHGIDSYARDIRLYVEPWAAELRDVTAAVNLWHGEADNWAPIAMSAYLQQQLTVVTTFTRCAGQAHYTCLLENAAAAMACVPGRAQNNLPE